MLINLDKVKVSRPALFRNVAQQLGYTGDPFLLVLGTREIRDDEIDLEVRRLLKIWVSTESEKPAAPAEPSEPQIDMAEVLREEQADMKRAADQQQAVLRLKEWAVAGLEDTQTNADLIKDFIEKSDVHGYLSREIVDAAVANLGPRGTNQLTWKPKEAPAPPPEPAEPAELLSTLPDGTKQLPLDVDNATLRRASKDQARDWLARTNAGKLIRPKGGFSSSIF